jgi:hypothetical protein
LIYNRNNQQLLFIYLFILGGMSQEEYFIICRIIPAEILYCLLLFWTISLIDSSDHLLPMKWNSKLPAIENVLWANYFIIQRSISIHLYANITCWGFHSHSFVLFLTVLSVYRKLSLCSSNRKTYSSLHSQMLIYLQSFTQKNHTLIELTHFSAWESMFLVHDKNLSVSSCVQDYGLKSLV